MGRKITTYTGPGYCCKCSLTMFDRASLILRRDNEYKKACAELNRKIYCNTAWYCKFCFVFLFGSSAWKKAFDALRSVK